MLTLAAIWQHPSRGDLAPVIGAPCTRKMDVLRELPTIELQDSCDSDKSGHTEKTEGTVMNLGMHCVASPVLKENLQSPTQLM